MSQQVNGFMLFIQGASICVRNASCISSVRPEHFWIGMLCPFAGRQGTEVRFNIDGDAYGSYNIYQYQQQPEGKYDYKQIGSWKET